LVVWPLVCEGVEAGGEGYGGDGVHGGRFCCVVFLGSDVYYVEFSGYRSKIDGNMNVWFMSLP
jgi:hypothetical protein